MKVVIRCSSEAFVPPRQLWRQAALILSLAAIGCVGETSDVTAPSKKEAFRALANTAESVSCDVAVRVSVDTYRVKHASIQIPAGLSDSTNGTVRLILFAWRHDQTGPGRIAGCQIPNAPAVLAYLKNALGKGFDQNASTNPQFASFHSRSKGSVGEEQYLDVEEGQCPVDSPIDYGCSCSGNFCSGWTIENVSHFDVSSSSSSSLRITTDDVKLEDVDETPKPKFSLHPAAKVLLSPAPKNLSDILIDTTQIQDSVELYGMSLTYSIDPNYIELPPPQINCEYNQDYPHGTYYINVHGWFQCDHPLPRIGVEVNVQFKTCLIGSLVCWWTTAPEAPPWKYRVNYSYVEDNHATACISGEWRARSKFKFWSWPDYHPTSWQATLNGPGINIFCPPPPI